MHIIVSWILVTLMVITWYYDIYCDTLVTKEGKYLIIRYFYKGDRKYKVIIKLK